VVQNGLGKMPWKTKSLWKKLPASKTLQGRGPVHHVFFFIPILTSFPPFPSTHPKHFLSLSLSQGAQQHPHYHPVRGFAASARGGFAADEGVCDAWE
jgi:hypothetical protein